MDPKVAKKTQDTLGKIIKKPPLTDKLLGKPPFRFLHDIMTSVIKTTGFMQGLFSDTEMNSENVKDKDAKIAFLQKAIDMVCSVTGKDLSAKPVKIVAGHEPERTNEFLQALADAINKNVDNNEYVKRVLKGGRGGGSSKEEKKEDKKERDRAKSEDRRKGQDLEDKPEPEKADRKQEQSRDRGDQEGERKRERDKEKDRHKEKRHERDRHGEKRHDRDGERERDRHKDRERESKTADKPRESREERHKDRERPKKHSDVSPKKESHKSRRLSDNHTTRSHDPLQVEDLSEAETKHPEKHLTGDLTIDTQNGCPATNPGASESSERKYEGNSTLEANAHGISTVASRDLQKPGSRRDSIRPSNSSYLSCASGHAKSFIEQGESLATGDHWNVIPDREQSRDKENESPDREKVNGLTEEKHEPPTRLQRPASAKGSRRKRGGQESIDDPDGQNEDEDVPRPKEPMLGEGDLPPQVIAARQLGRPSSARPAPPRPKQDTVESEPAMRLGTGHPTNVIADNDNDDEDDDDNFLVQETAPPLPDPGLTPLKPVDELDTKHGALVQKMLESKKETERGNQGPNKKTEIERPLISDAQRRKQRELVQKEVDKLRASIQSLTRSANPLGKVMDYVQEDMDSMQQELDKWRAENAQHALDLKREMNVTDRAIDPLRQQLAELDRAVSDQLDRIAAVKSSIIKNDQKVQKMLRGISGS